MKATMIISSSKPRKLHHLSSTILILVSFVFVLAHYSNLFPSTATKPKPPREKPTAALDDFTLQAANFFDSRRCAVKFFMTWISRANSLGPRELLSVESIFKSNPNACLLIVSSSVTNDTLHPYISRGYSILTLPPDFAAVFKNTPAELWYDDLINDRIDPGEIPIGQNLSNLLRIVLLYKLGGIYLDTDVIVMKELSHVRNAIGAQAIDPETGNWSRLNNAVMIFDQGHPLLYEFVKEFVTTFDGSTWGFNGPYLVSRVVSRVEGREGFDQFTVLRQEAFYPVAWTKVKGWFEGPRGRRHERWVAAKFEGVMRESYGLHLWNRESRRVELEEGSVVGRIVRECCVLCNFSMSKPKNS